MRSLTPIAMIVMLGAVAATARAQDDLDLLLGELTFPDSGSAQPAAPAPPSGAGRTGVSELVDPVVISTERPAGSQQPESPRQPEEPPQSEDASQLRELPSAGGAELSLPVDPPRTRYQRPTDPLPRGAAGEAAVADSPAPAVESEPIPAPRGAAEPPRGAPSAAHVGFPPPQGRPVRIADASCGRPNLPPPSSLRQYFHSKPCYRDLWAGYGYEAQMRCQHYHKHLHGTCDCFKPPYSPPVYRAGGRPVCGGCDGSKCSAGH